MRAAWRLAVGALLGGGFYLLLIDTTSLPELYGLAGVAVVCACGFYLAREEGFVEAAIRLGWLARAWRLAWQIPADIALLCLEALGQLLRPRAVRGGFRAGPSTAPGQTPQDVGRRALTEWLGSVSPNTIVIGVDRERGLLLVHQLRPRGAAENLDVLRLQ